ncbi:hypothetical protein D3C72_595610 [compost metagenome]
MHGRRVMLPSGSPEGLRRIGSAAEMFELKACFGAETSTAEGACTTSPNPRCLLRLRRAAVAAVPEQVRLGSGRTVSAPPQGPFSCHDPMTALGAFWTLWSGPEHCNPVVELRGLVESVLGLDLFSAARLAMLHRGVSREAHGGLRRNRAGSSGPPSVGRPWRRRPAVLPRHRWRSGRRR